MASPHFASQKINITIMSQMIVRGKEMLRISPKDSKKVEFSTNDGELGIPDLVGLPMSVNSQILLMQERKYLLKPLKAFSSRRTMVEPGIREVD